MLLFPRGKSVADAINIIEVLIFCLHTSRFKMLCNRRVKINFTLMHLCIKLSAWGRVAILARV